MGAFDSLRLEKGYRALGTDLQIEYNPYEAGLGWAVDLDQGDFLGREALLDIKQTALAKKLCCLAMDEGMALGKEPIFASGSCIGYVTSANYGYSVGKHIAYGYLPAEHAQKGTQVEIEYLGKRFTAEVADDPLFDPQMKNLKA
jgi:glycine cleavage system aminomethyltransferase T